MDLRVAFPRATLVLVCVLLGAHAARSEEPKQDTRSASAWIDALRSEDAFTRRKAAFALFQLEDAPPEAALPLARTLADADAYVAETAYSALVKLRDAAGAVPHLVTFLGADPTLTPARRLALWALLRIDPKAVFRHAQAAVQMAALRVVVEPNDFLDEAVFAELVHLAHPLSGSDADVRALAANALGNTYCFSGRKMPYRDAARATLSAQFLASSSDESANVRQWSNYALSWIARGLGDSEAEPLLAHLVKATGDPVEDVRWGAFIALGVAGKRHATAEAAFLAGLQDPRSRVRAAALGWASVVVAGTPRVVEAVAASLEDPSLRLRAKAARALGAFGAAAEGTLPALLALFRSEDDPILRAAVAEGFAGIGGAARSALPDLEEAFAAAREPPAVYAYAVVRLGPEDPQAALARLVEVAVSDVGGRAQAWLGRLGPAAASVVPALVARLQQGTAPERVQAAWTLACMGPVAKEAAPALEAVLAATPAVSAPLREAAQDALEAVRKQR